MKIVIACDSYKGCMSASEVVSTIEKGIKKANVNHQRIWFSYGRWWRRNGRYRKWLEAIGGKMVDVTVDAYGKAYLERSLWI